ncbi:tetratricopeptide repeat protein [Arenibacter latericius]|uniref:tetratricopeptide repeat protein n=1 Tax=Arenibacter latericius TaxID=86104 RepID=UPI0003F55445|nr:hypothetical protein [Arenibacter latericius]
MNKIGYLFYLAIGCILTPISTYAQKVIFEEEESAELSLEAYSDEFQELFFEALKQKGIENYDRAINLFLEGKTLGTNNAVIDYELAKAYLASKNYVQAQEYAIAALNSKPEDYWVLQTAYTIMAKQGLMLDDIKNKIPFTNAKMQKNIVLIYYEHQNYEAAKELLLEMKSSSFTKEYSLKIDDHLRIKKEKPAELFEEVEKQVTKQSPIDNYLNTLSALLDKSDYKELQLKSMEAMENFPAQPYFYYTYGLALNMQGKHKEAVSILESGIDVIIDDNEILNKIYKELADAYTALGNSSKANLYLSKIKSGS